MFTRQQHIRDNGVIEEDIVITGISGRFPESDNIEEFKQHLFDGVDLVTADGRRWPPGLYGLPERMAKLKNVSYFDASFFGVSNKQAEFMDPQLRLLLELTYEALVDAGVNPAEVRGTNTGVFVGSQYSEAFDYWLQDHEKINAYQLMGCSKAMFANRISYTFDFHGPSFCLDTACSSSLVALHQACTAIRDGKCDAAIVGGANLVLMPEISLTIQNLRMLNKEGMCKTFDASANGYARAEAVAVVYLQKASVARRIYATLVGINTNADGYKPEGITYPSGQSQLELAKEVYEKNNINPMDVTYVEAHGTGTHAGDPQETNMIAELFCKNRKEPLLIGAVKSNMGHAESASGLCSLAKLIIAMETGTIPANLHFKTPNKNIPGLFDGRLKVVVRNEQWKGGLMAMNSYGFGGANVHLAIRPNLKEKFCRYTRNLPRIIGVSGRTEEAVLRLLDGLEQHKNDEEFYALFESVYSKDISGHLIRGYTILNDKSTREVSQTLGSKRPVWFVYSGMGSQWAGIARDLMEVEVFKNSLTKCANTLRPYGVKLMEILLSNDDSIFNNVINCFVAITVTQIALTDVLSLLGIEPDGVIGHSTGEVACAYADGTLTAEQTTLVAYFRARAIVESNVPAGAMAAIGMSWEEAKKRCPPEVFPVCNNCEDGVTVGGNPESIEKFVAELKAKNIFATKVNSCDLAFHCKYTDSAVELMHKYCREIIPNPKPRSRKWISSSVPESNWRTTLAQYCSSDYLVNNFSSSVLFYEGSKHIPEDAIVIEVAPHGLLQSTLLRTLGPKATILSLIKRRHKDNLEFLLSNLGKLYIAGAQPQFGALYPPVTFPVGKGTPMISPLIKWDHSHEWAVGNYQTKASGSRESVIEVDLSSEEYQFLDGHTIDGRIIFPATGYLVLVWKTFAKLRLQQYDQMCVVFENVRFHRATIMIKGRSVKFLINIFEGSGEFELYEGGSTTVTGRIYIPEDPHKEELELPKPEIHSEGELLPLTSDDIYKALKLRGYGYSGLFRGIMESDNLGRYGKVKWKNNWISFIDTVLQYLFLSKNTKELYLPVKLQKFFINPKALMEKIKTGDPENSIPVYTYKDISVLKSVGIEIRGLRAHSVPRRDSQHSPKVEKYILVPYHNKAPLVNEPMKQKETALTVLLQIVLENTSRGQKINVTEIGQNHSAELALSPLIKNLFEAEPSVQVDIVLITKELPDDATVFEANQISLIKKDVIKDKIERSSHLVVIPEFLIRDEKLVSNIIESLKPGGFVLTEIREEEEASKLFSHELEVVSIQRSETNIYALLREPVKVPENYDAIQISESEFSWIEPLKQAMRNSEKSGKRVYLYAQAEISNGLIGLVNCLMMEPAGKFLRSFFIQDLKAPKFTVNTYSDQIKKDLVHNILKNGEWGCYRHILIDPLNENSKLQVEHAYINTLHRGDLSTIRWIEGPLSYYKDTDPNMALCSVYYAPLNFRDVMLATGKLAPDALPGDQAGQDCILGLEFSGRDSQGKRVMGMVPARGLATTVAADKRFLLDVPSNWSLEEASTVPVVYATSYYALIMRGRMQSGESVLIHAGSGGVGQSAISIALHMKCQVFTTVSSQAKKDFLKKMFPQLRDENIGYSRDTSFEQMILTNTNGRGVDLVLNSLAGEQLQASVRCLAQGGRFLEIGKVDLSIGSPLSMDVFLKNTTFHGILLDAIFYSDTADISFLMNLIREGIKNGAVKPLSRIIYNQDQVEEAFRFMASGNHIGKVVVKIRDEESCKVQLPNSKFVTAIPRTYMNPNKSYIIVGGLGGLGLELTNWLIQRGATKVIINSRSGLKTGYQSLRVRWWHELGVEVIISTDDVTTEEGSRKLLQKANDIGPVGGIFNLAAVLRDAMMENLSEKDFEIVCKPKVDATKHLDAVSRAMAPQLDYFVTFSSLACGRGNISQANYGFANSAMERICETRQKEGLPGLSIQWGAVGDVGLIIDIMGRDDLEISGTLPQKISSCLATLDSFLQQPNPVVSSFVLAEKHRTEDTKNNLVDNVAHIMGIKDINTVPSTATLADRGMDSLTGTQIKQTLERDYDIILSMQEIRNLTFGRLIELSSKVPVATTTKSTSSTGIKNESIFTTKTHFVPVEVLIQMPSKSGKTGTAVFLVHPIEGSVIALETLAKNIEATVYGLQCTASAPLSSITDLAKHYVSYIKSVQPNGPYRLIGYSYGGCIAFEMGVQLEKCGDKVRILFVDGSPSYLAAQTNKEYLDDPVRQECEAMLYFASQFKNINQKDETSVLQRLENVKQRIARTVEIISDVAPFSKEELSVAAEFYLRRLLAARNYKPVTKFEGQATLIKAKESIFPMEEDYGLSQICKQEVRIYTIEGTHISILREPQVQKIVEIVHDILLK